MTTLHSASLSLRRSCFAAIVLASLGLSLFFAAPARSSGNDSATVTFRKIFKQSYPEFVEIKISEGGSATYDIRQLDEQPAPQPFEVSRALVDRIFQLAAQLHHFDGIDLDVHRRIASLGQKTFRYEKGGESHEVVFNYTLDASANQLLDIFEGFGREQVDLDNLQRSMRYDRLGVNDALVRLEADYNGKLFPEPERLLPTLDQLAADEKYLDIARQRARTLAGRIRNSHT
jgi:hypothetical protein